MRLNLREIINMPGGKVGFDYEPDISDLEFDGVVRFTKPLRAEGTIVNEAGVLILRADLTAETDLSVRQMPARV